ncbi:hypothetical protein BH23CHL7_BH23CHL7_06500 [soil metagenome]
MVSVVRGGSNETSMSARSAALDVHALGAAYIARFEELLRSIDLNALEGVVHQLRRARDEGRSIFICGNGGSAATASHWVNDLGKATKVTSHPWMRVTCLSDNVSWLTALANDEGYERAFAGQLENFARAGDILIVISASGRSPNLIEAVKMAESVGMVTVGLFGFDGGVLRERVNECLWLPTEPGAYGLVETGHSLLADLITHCLVHDRDVAEVVTTAS